MTPKKDMPPKAQPATDTRQELIETLHLLFRYIHAKEQRILDFALESAVRVTGSRIGYIYLVSEDETELRLHAWSKEVMADCAVVNYSEVYKTEHTGLWGEAMRQRRAVVSNDVPASPWARGFPKGHIPVFRHLNLPVFDGNRIVLLAGVGNKETDYTEDDITALSLVMDATWNIVKRKQAEQVLADTNAQLEKIVDERTEEYETTNTELHRIIEQQQAIEAALASQQEQLEIIVNNVPALIAYVDKAMKYRFVNTRYRDMFFPECSEVDGQEVGDLLDKEIFRRVKARYKAVLAGAEQRFELEVQIKDVPRILDVVYIPHWNQNRVEGAFVLITDVTERKRIELELKHLSVTDPLTGAKNRRYFLEKTRAEIQRARRYCLPVTLLTMDIDLFKHVNDTHGHDAGDEVLKACVRTWQKALRETDIFSRLGGEEFAALLVQTSQDQAMVMAERLRKQMEAMAVAVGNAVIRITVSIGVAGFLGQDDSLDAMMKRCDAALYRAKDKGRNRVEAA